LEFDMKKFLVSAALFLGVISLHAQLNNPPIVPVFTAPSGSCPSGLPNQQVVSTGTQYSCQNVTAGVGTWGILPGGGGGSTTNALTAAATGGAAPGSTFNGSAAVTFDYHSFGAASLGANTFTGNQTATGLTLSTVANAAAPTGVATNSGQSVPASTTNEAAITCIDSGGNTTVGTASANVTTTGAASYIVWSYTLPSGCTTGYIWMKNTGSFSYYSVATGTSFTQNAAYTTYTAAASYPAGAAYPANNTTGLLKGASVIIGSSTPNSAGDTVSIQGGLSGFALDVKAGYVGGGVVFRGSDGSYWEFSSGNIQSSTSFLLGTNVSNGYFAMAYGAGMEGARLTGAGLFGIGTSTPSSKLTVNGAISNGVTTATNSDNRGHITLSSGTGSYTFTQGPGTAGIWTTAPVCVIQDDTTLANLATSTKTVSTSTLTITGSVGTTDTYSYICWPGN
jgi:hypothetical protein